jgi:hypothetical protein
MHLELELGGGLGQISESLAAFELGILDNTCHGDESQLSACCT